MFSLVSVCPSVAKISEDPVKVFQIILQVLEFNRLSPIQDGRLTTFEDLSLGSISIFDGEKTQIS